MADSGRSPVRTGVWIGVAAITMFFAAITSAMVVRQGAAPDWAVFRLPRILYLNTLVLLASSAALERGRARIAHGGAGRLPLAPDAVRWLAVTLGLGVLFVAGQVAAWRGLAAQGVFLASSPSSSFFYLFTVLHALHLTGGLVALGWVLYRVTRPAGAVPHDAIGGAALYWHFMDGLWLYVLFLLFTRM